MSGVFGPPSTRGAMVQRHDWGTMEWLVDDAIIADAEVSVARMTLKDGGTAEAHSHSNCNEVIHLLSGRIEQSIGDERYVMEPGDTAFVPQGSRHRSRNLGSGDAVMIVSYSAGTRIYRKAESA